jgi:2'-5' RNA ligase
MRIFTAIPIPNEVKNKLVAMTRGKLPVSYLNTINLHITLNFLGDLTQDELHQALGVFEEAVGVARPKINIVFDKLTKFGQQIHLTLQLNPALADLQKDLESALKGAGLRFQDREYYPHVKLANMHIDNTLYRDRKIENFPMPELQELNFIAGKISLYESKLLLHHAHHASLKDIDLI